MELEYERHHAEEPDKLGAMQENNNMLAHSGLYWLTRPGTCFRYSPPCEYNNVVVERVEALNIVPVRKPFHIRLMADGRVCTKKAGETECCIGSMSADRPYFTQSARGLRTFALWAGGDDLKAMHNNLKPLARELQSLQERGLDVRGGKALGEQYSTDEYLGFAVEEYWVPTIEEASSDDEGEGEGEDEGEDEREGEENEHDAAAAKAQERKEELQTLSVFLLKEQLKSSKLSSQGSKEQLIDRLVTYEVMIAAMTLPEKRKHDLNHMTVSGLKVICSEHDLQVSGKVKSELIQSILEKEYPPGAPDDAENDAIDDDDGDDDDGTSDDGGDDDDDDEDGGGDDDDDEDDDDDCGGSETEGVGVGGRGSGCVGVEGGGSSGGVLDGRGGGSSSSMGGEGGEGGGGGSGGVGAGGGAGVCVCVCLNPC